MSDTPRITLIARRSNRPGMDWRLAENGVVFTESLDVVRFLLSRGMSSVDLDVERVVLDRCAGDRDLLDLLTIVPEDFAGDIVQILEDGSGYLSAAGRGGGRTLYQLAASDIRFYLEAHNIVSGRLALQKIA